MNEILILTREEGYGDYCLRCRHLDNPIPHNINEAKYRTCRCLIYHVDLNRDSKGKVLRCNLCKNDQLDETNLLVYTF